MKGIVKDILESKIELFHSKLRGKIVLPKTLIMMKSVKYIME